jgi:hypothetical protein
MKLMTTRQCLFLSSPYFDSSLSLFSSLPPSEWTPGCYQPEGSSILSHDSGRQLSIFGLDVGTNKSPFSSSAFHEDPDLFTHTEMPNLSPPRSGEGENPLLEQTPYLPPSPTPPPPRPPKTRRCQYTFPNIIQRNAHTSTRRHSLSVSYEECAEGEKESVNYEKEREEVGRYMQDTRMEIVVILEGVDPLTSHTVQAFHSYKSEDIEWDQFFAPCTFLDSDGWTVVDFMKFHNLNPVPSDPGSHYRPCSTSHC